MKLELALEPKGVLGHRASVGYRALSSAQLRRGTTVEGKSCYLGAGNFYFISLLSHLMLLSVYKGLLG